jgi:hypothetical protein
MNVRAITVSALAAVLLSASAASSQAARISFSFNAPSISGFPTGAAFLTGGGAYDPATGFVKAGGAFRCLEDINQGPLAGCKAGEGVRWDAVQVLPSLNFKCSANGSVQTATTGDDTIVILADFYRQGDGIHESFTAPMIVTRNPAAANAGFQTVWIAGVGCGQAPSNQP